MKRKCPFCLSDNTLAIVCNDSIAPKNSTYSDRCNQNRLKEKKAIMSNLNNHYSIDYDGTIIIRKTYDRYCKNCGRPYYYISNLYTCDIKELTFIIETKNDRWKYYICFDNDNSYYNIDHNYFTKEYHSSLTPVRKRKILEGIKNSKIFNWKPLDDKFDSDYYIKWGVFITFNNEQLYTRGGYDDYPCNWNIFIKPFISVFKNEIFKKMKNINITNTRSIM